MYKAWLGAPVLACFLHLSPELFRSVYPQERFVLFGDFGLWEFSTSERSAFQKLWKHRLAGRDRLAHTHNYAHLPSRISFHSISLL